jgi:lipoprotein
LLYLSQGNGAKFKAYVEKEAELYPESREYAMFLLNQNSKTKGAAGKTAANLKAKDANLGEQTKEKVGASESNSNDKSSNLSEQTSKQNLKNKQAKPAKTSKTAKGSQNEK